MDNSTEGVTLYALFINDVLNYYKGKEKEYSGLFAIAQGHDLSDPYAKVPMQVYNNVCAWVERELGKYNLIRVGRTIGESVYQGMVANDFIPASAQPLQVMEALVKAAATMIQDPTGRGWEIVGHTPASVRMKRTQTFNSKLQLGLLDGLIRKAPNVFSVNVDYEKSVENGDEYDVYLITWLNG